MVQQHTQYYRSRKALSGTTYILAFMVALTYSVLSAKAEGFPGKGNPGAWSDALPYYNLANRYLEKERWDDAAAKYREAIDRYPFDPDFYTNLGIACRKLNDYVGEEQAFKQSIKLNGKDWSSWNNLANAYLKQNRLADTIATLEKASRLNPPATDKAAIAKDIADIKKIMQMQPAQGTKKASISPAHNATSKTNSTPRAGAKSSRQTTNDNNKAGQVGSDPALLQHSIWDWVGSGAAD